MSLTKEEKNRIKEEEAYRKKIREELGLRKQINQTLDKENKKPRGFWKVFLITAGFIFTISFISILFGSPSNNKDTSRRESTDSYQNAGNSSTVNNESNTSARVIQGDEVGIDVSRNVLIQTFEGEGYSFRRDTNIDGEENYIGTKGAGEIQLLGEKENLSSASFTTNLNSNIDSDEFVSLSEMVLFSSTIDRKCTEWLLSKQKEAHANINNVYNKAEVYCDRKLTLYYFPGDSMTFGVEPEQ